MNKATLKKAPLGSTVMTKLNLMAVKIDADLWTMGENSFDSEALIARLWGEGSYILGPGNALPVEPETAGYSVLVEIEGSKVDHDGVLEALKNVIGMEWLGGVVSDAALIDIGDDDSSDGQSGGIYKLPK